MTEVQRRELAEITASLKQGLGLLLRNGDGSTQTAEQRFAELQRQKQIILAQYPAREESYAG